MYVNAETYISWMPQLGNTGQIHSILTSFLPAKLPTEKKAVCRLISDGQAKALQTNRPTNQLTNKTGKQTHSFVEFWLTSENWHQSWLQEMWQSKENHKTFFQ